MAKQVIIFWHFICSLLVSNILWCNSDGRMNSCYENKDVKSSYFICNILSCLIKGRGILKKVLLAVNLTLLAARAVCTTVNLWPSHHSDFFWEKKRNRVNISITILSVFDTFLFLMVSELDLDSKKFWNWPKKSFFETGNWPCLGLVTHWITVWISSLSAFLIWQA